MLPEREHEPMGDAKRTEGKKRGRKPRHSWLTTDEQEIEVRQQRAQIEAMEVRLIGGGVGVFSDYVVVPADEEKEGREYFVELRSFENHGNYCTCPDFAKSFLGTCKHIEKVKLHARKSRTRDIRSDLAEIVAPTHPGGRPAVLFPAWGSGKWKRFLRGYLDADNRFRNPWQDTLQVFLRDLEQAPHSTRNRVRVSRGIRQLAERVAESQQATAARRRLSAEFDNSSFLRHPLYDYQREGMMHLAFTGRALLTDEMGLGKTVQAIGAAKVLRELRGISRVLIVCPASLKAEWEEQIRQFTSLPCRIVYGLRPARLKQYRTASEFFLITNYEQIIRDEQEINEWLQPDLVILDEAQRIKNWKTKTAQSIKRLQSRYAFVLTGTPLENRIDEIYSLVDFVDDRLLGSLFRFNREFYRFDEDGRVTGMKNLRKLHERLQPVMLRRRKSEIEDQLPARVDNNYFVRMTQEQSKRYAEYEYQVSILSSMARRRPLRPGEFQRLQMCLACMRMLCDSVHILDQEIKDAPKVDELLKVLSDIWSAEPGRKVIVFSEWVRMLDLVREQLDTQGIDYAWHVGSVPQRRRRDEIQRFKNTAQCCVFLSSDSGSVGLNLQAATVVVNMDLPWNPAKLEQRIARAWRKHQTQTVNVINLIAEKTIEHRMLATIGFKQSLADGVLDGAADWEALEGAAAKRNFMARLSTVINTSFAAQTTEEPSAAPEPVAATPADERFRQEANVGLADVLGLCRVKTDRTSERVTSVFGVARKGRRDATEQVQTALAKSGHEAQSADVTILQPDQYELLKMLAAKGVISFEESAMEELFRAESLTEPAPDDRRKRCEAAGPLLEKAARSAKMAGVLQAGGFPVEAAAPARQALEHLAPALAILAYPEMPATPPVRPEDVDFAHVTSEGVLDEQQTAFLRNAAIPDDGDDAAVEYVSAAAEIVECAQAALVRLQV